MSKNNTVTVIRADHATNISEEDLRNGDIVLIQAGDLVPADIKLIETRNLELDEFHLTGEIKPVDKKINGEEAYAYKGSRVTRGNGKGIVITSGKETEFEEVLKQSSEQWKNKLPTLFRGKYLLLIFLLLPPLVVSLKIYNNYVYVFSFYFLIAVSFLILQNSELVRYLIASREVKNIQSNNIQIDASSLDCVAHLNTICFDKTGVLTTRNIEVKDIYFAGETPDTDLSLPNENLVNIGCALCNDVIYIEKRDQADPIDRALIDSAVKNGADVEKLRSTYKRIYDKPFDSENRYMATGFTRNGQTIFFAKGDPEVILKMCGDYQTTSNLTKKVDSQSSINIRSKMDSINQRGDISIALAYHSSSSIIPPSNYTFLCLIQLVNPLKPGVPEIVTKLKQKGIRTYILTGDRPETALKIGKEIGMEYTKYCLTGNDMVKMEFSEIAKQSDYVSIFARLLPSQKGVLIRLMQQRNRVVVMVGDGFNDVIALRAADVGVSLKENSSPFARRVSKILINDLADLSFIIEKSNGILRFEKWFKIFRVFFIISILFILYFWIFM
jgi:Ca2+-transporting ATPase